MAQYPNQYGTTTKETDQFGNPIQHGTAGATGFGTATTGTGHRMANDPYTGGQRQQERGMMDKIKDKIPGTGGARRADDPYSSNTHTGTGTTGTGYGTTGAPHTGGEYRERGLMDKVKDCIPGTGHKNEAYSSHTTPTTAPYGGTTYTGERKHEGIMDKIPGTGHRNEAYSSHTTSTTAPYGGTTGEHYQKKGIMDKIKEKLPGGHR